MSLPPLTADCCINTNYMKSYQNSSWAVYNYKNCLYEHVQCRKTQNLNVMVQAVIHLKHNMSYKLVIL
jgi:hypothetical protein